jgi:triphosphoribosyl-dephospho-CoA synthase
MSPGLAAQLACILEISAPKAGNVHFNASFDDLDARDFLVSAAAIAGPMDQSPIRSIGHTVLASIFATSSLVSTNTNLGIVLLLAPMAAQGDQPVDRATLSRRLESTTVEDACLVYQAIRLANPGGLGRVDEQDVADEPIERLIDVMRRAAERDLVARQYATGFADIFEVGVPSLREALGAELSIENAIVRAHLTLISRLGDSLIERKCGADTSRVAARMAREVLSRGWPETRKAIDHFERFDAWLRADGNRRNPGATADLVVAVIYVGLQAGWIRIPRAKPE